MRLVSFVIVFIFVFPYLCSSKIIPIKKNYPLINGAQVFVISEEYIDNPDNFFKEAKSKGVNTIFFRVFQNKGDRTHYHLPSNCESGVYFKTDEACVVNDIIRPLINAAHANGIKFFAWMATRSLSFLKDSDNISYSFSPDNIITTGYGANIFKQNVRQKLIGLFRDLASYNIDGILMQDDFIIKYTEGADKEAVTLFKKETGLNATPELFFDGISTYNNKKIFVKYKQPFYTWASWKNKHLTELLAELINTAKNVNPNIMFAANVYYETPINPKQGLAWYSQDLSVLNKIGIDYLAVMGYSEQIADEQHLNIKKTGSLIKKIALSTIKNTDNDPSRVIIKLQSKSFKGNGMLSKKDFNIICSEIQKIKNISTAIVPIFSDKEIYPCFR